MTESINQIEKVLLSPEQIKGQVLDHHGLMAAVLKKIKLAELIDGEMPVNKKARAKLTNGQKGSAIILNGLGYMNDRLYMFPKFMENKPIARLFDDPTIRAEYFNDDSIGRHLDAVKEYGVTKLFSRIAFAIGAKFDLLGRTARLDTSTISVYGEYAVDEELLKAQEAVAALKFKDGLNSRVVEKPIKVTHGYSKDHRQDLKQVTILLCTTGASSFPVWMEAHDGNASDKTKLQEAASRMKAVCDQVKEMPSFIYVGDSAMYEACVKDGENLTWLSRVPCSIKKAKEIQGLPDDKIKWAKSNRDSRYKFYEFKAGYGDVQQRWLLVFSEPAYKLEVQTLEKNVLKEQTALTKILKKLSHKAFFCVKDAEKYFRDHIEKEAKYHDIEYTVNAVMKHKSSGRPKKGAAPKKVEEYRIESVLKKSDSKIEAVQITKGRFILATNELNKAKLSKEDMLFEYKQQSKTECGFRFIKNNAFHVSSIFLKNPGRIEALMMYMTLSLMVYSLGQMMLRKALEESQEMVPDQLGKPTKTPTLVWICRQFHGVQVLKISFGTHSQELVSNLNDLTKQIIGHFGEEAEKIYGLAEA